eukprot:6212390-Pleurochrysis_carterae.AAC.6
MRGCDLVLRIAVCAESARARGYVRCTYPRGYIAYRRQRVPVSQEPCMTLMEPACECRSNCAFVRMRSHAHVCSGAHVHVRARVLALQQMCAHGRAAESNWDAPLSCPSTAFR